MFLRYFACTDESPLGHTAAAYCDALVATGVPVRLVPTRVAELQTEPGVRFDSIWDNHRNLLITPMDGDFINLVCGEVKDWAGYYTSGVTNALLLSVANMDGHTVFTSGASALCETAFKYDVVYAPSHFLASWFSALTGIMPTRVALGTTESADAFRKLKVF